MYVHNDGKLVYLANPRTASTSTADALLEVGFEKVGTHHSKNLAGPLGDGWLTFSAVRNHWDTAVSWVMAHNLSMTLESVEQVLDNEYTSDDEMWAYHSPDITMRYEELGMWLNMILVGRGLARAYLPKRNVSVNRAKRHYSELHTPWTRTYIYNRFADEIARLGYRYEQRA